MPKKPDIIFHASLQSAPYSVEVDKQKVRHIFDTVGVPIAAIEQTKVILYRKRQKMRIPFQVEMGRSNNRDTIYLNTERFYDLQKKATTQEARQRVDQELDLTIAHEAQHIKDGTTNSIATRRQRRLDAGELVTYLASALLFDKAYGFTNSPKDMLIASGVEVAAGVVMHTVFRSLFYKQLPLYCLDTLSSCTSLCPKL